MAREPADNAVLSTTLAPHILPADSSRIRRDRLFALVILAAYAAALIWRRDAVPAGMNNDVAEEALRGLYLADGPHFEVMTFAIGHSAETLYLYLVGAAAHWLGPTPLSILLVSWTFALACIVLIWKLVRSVTDSVPSWLPLLTTACSMWLFHYARNGLRTISAPFFLASFALLLNRAERKHGAWPSALACGAVLGLSIYAYTSARALPLAFIAYALIQLFRGADSRRDLIRRYAAILLGAAVVSLPNLLFLVRNPRPFLARGGYVIGGGLAERLIQLLWSLLMPFYYPDHYRLIQVDNYHSDGVAAGFTSAGLNPLPWVFALACLIGAWRLRRFFARPVALFLACFWLVAVFTIGMAGPCPTRLLILFPVLLVCTALGFGWMIEKRPVLTIPVALLIVAVGAFDGHRYFSGSTQGPYYRVCYDPAPRAIGERADVLAGQGQRVLAVVSRDSSVIRYLTYRHGANVTVAEFFARPFDDSAVPLNDFRPGVLLIQSSAEFQTLVARLPAEWRVAGDDRFAEFRLPPR